MNRDTRKLGRGQGLDNFANFHQGYTVLYRVVNAKQGELNTYSKRRTHDINKGQKACICDDAICSLRLSGLLFLHP